MHFPGMLYSSWYYTSFLPPVRGADYLLPKDPGHTPSGGPLRSTLSTWAPSEPRLLQRRAPPHRRPAPRRAGALTSDAPGTFPAASDSAWGRAGRGARMRHSASTLPGSCGGLSLSASTASARADSLWGSCPPPSSGSLRSWMPRIVGSSCTW